jgi:hypothetical protein
MSKLSQKLIDIIEEAILSNKLMSKDTDNIPAISYCDYENAESGYNMIKYKENNYYIQFASNSAGMCSYGFYKANNGEIYIIQAWINKITKIYIPSKKWNCLQNVIKDEYTCKSKGS